MSRRNSTRARNQQALPRVGDPDRVEHAFACRESAIYDHVLMAGMITQTLSPHVGKIDGVDEVLGWGLEPIKEPNKYGVTVQRLGSTRVFVFEHKKTVYIYSMASASSVHGDDKSENGFVRILTDLLAELRPFNLHTSTFSRLVRAAEYSGQLLATAKEAVDTIYCGDMVIRPGTPAGRTMWQTMTMVADQEREAIERRLLVGRLLKAQKGQWLSGDLGHPPGYFFDRETGELQWSAEERPQIEAMLEYLASDLPAWRVAELVGELGISTPRLTKIAEAQWKADRAETETDKTEPEGQAATAEFDPTSVTVAGARQPGSIIRTLRGWVELYRDGIITQYIPNPFAGIDQLAGVPVLQGILDDDKHKHGSFQLTWRPGVPPDGWTDNPSVFDAIETANPAGSRRRYRRPGVGASRRPHKPLSDLVGWADGKHEYRLLCLSTTYQLRRRAKARQGTSWRLPKGPNDGELLGSANSGDLHEAMATSIAEAIADGVSAEVLDGHSAWMSDRAVMLVRNPVDDRITLLRQQIEEAREQEKNARKNANRVGDDHVDQGLVASFLDDARQASRDRARLERELQETEALASAGSPWDLGDRFESEAGFIARALANLATTQNATDPRVNHALGNVLQDVRMWADAFWLHFSLYVLVPADGMVVRLGPVVGKVENVYIQKGDKVDTRYRETLQRVLGGGEKLADVYAERNVRAQASLTVIRGNLARLLVDDGMAHPAASALLACPIPETRQAVWSYLHGTPPPPDVDPAWAEHAGKSYVDRGWDWSGHRWQYASPPRQLILDWLAARGGRVKTEDIDAGFPGSSSNWRTYTKALPSGHPATLARNPLPEGQTWCRLDWVSPVPCPHCGGWADLVMRVPEVPTSLLCSGCLREPVGNSPVFPEAYRQHVRRELDKRSRRNDPAA